ncbi:coiled-coil domain-containing protein 1-like [Cynara cardunculus var. scolymus]|uniref:coiled-coil domain-containing protein 1-like n=1 Tax=Cynara cardunculus var. scolymus TaxID=59895 RepID=UPI000D630FDE|nr:coiled-coil domain-containing protein 1-like [Cynara cardunculus var. scolymus]
MPLRDDLSSNLSVVKVEVNDVKELLTAVQVDVRTNVEAISALNSKADALEQQLDIITESIDDLTSHYTDDKEAEAESVRADAQDEDLSITSAANVGDKEDDDDDEADDPFSFPDAGKDLGADDENDDDDNFTIQYHTKPATAQKGVSLMESSSQGEKEKESNV